MQKWLLLRLYYHSQSQVTWLRRIFCPHPRFSWLLFVLFPRCKWATQKGNGYLWHLGGIHKNDLHGLGEEVGTFSPPAILLHHGGFASSL